MTTEQQIETYKNWVAFRCWFKWTRLTIMFKAGYRVGALQGRIATLKDVLEDIVPVQADIVKKVVRDEIANVQRELDLVLQGKNE